MWFTKSEPAFVFPTDFPVALDMVETKIETAIEQFTANVKDTDILKHLPELVKHLIELHRRSSAQTRDTLEDLHHMATVDLPRLIVLTKESSQVPRTLVNDLIDVQHLLRESVISHAKSSIQEQIKARLQVGILPAGVWIRPEEGKVRIIIPNFTHPITRDDSIMTVSVRLDESNVLKGTLSADYQLFLKPDDHFEVPLEQKEVFFAKVKEKLQEIMTEVDTYTAGPDKVRAHYFNARIALGKL